MASLLTATVERTFGWFYPGAQRRTAHQETRSELPHAQTERTIPLDLRARQWFCAAKRGHDFILGIDRRRMYLICQNCFHETPGWALTEKPPRKRG